MLPREPPPRDPPPPDPQWRDPAPPPAVPLSDPADQAWLPLPETGAQGPPWAAPPAGWVPPGTFAAQLRALLTERLPSTLRGAQWSPGRRGLAALVVLALAGIAFAVVLLVRGRAHAVAIEPPGPVPALPSLSALPTAGASAAAPADVLVDVEGKVARPGLVRLPRGSRVDDALRAAGGALPGADTSGLNRAQVLVDGEQIRVDLPGAAVGDTAGVPGAASVSASGTAAAGTPVDLNTATVAQLDALPGVGPVTAQHIIDWRTQHGSFSSVEQLQEVGGIGPATYAKLAALVTV